jgi:hypothetical protein
MTNTRFQCHRRGSGSLVVVVMMTVVHMMVVMVVVQSSGVSCVRGGFHSDRGWQAEVIGICSGCKGWLFRV